MDIYQEAEEAGRDWRDRNPQGSPLQSWISFEELMIRHTEWADPHPDEAINGERWLRWQRGAFTEYYPPPTGPVYHPLFDPAAPFHDVAIKLYFGDHPDGFDQVVEGDPDLAWAAHHYFAAHSFFGESDDPSVITHMGTSSHNSITRYDYRIYDAFTVLEWAQEHHIV